MSTCKRLLAVTQLTICFCLYNANILRGDGVTKIQTQFLTEYDFLRIPEIFTGKEFTGSRVIVRSSPARKGLYFSIPLGKKSANIRKGKRVEVQLIDTTSLLSRNFSFSLPEFSYTKKDLFIGITGSDWNQSAMKLVAWKVEIFNFSKEPLISRQSALWGHSK
jgi:hypothetical protein